MHSSEGVVAMKKCCVMLVCVIICQGIKWGNASEFAGKGPMPIVTSDVFKNETAANLTSIILDSCNIKSIKKDSFKNMYNLTYLQIVKNYIDNLEVGTFQETLKLKYINLQSNELKELKNGIFAKLISTEELYLQKNRLGLIEANVFNDMQSLQLLKLGENWIVTLDADIFKNNGKLIILSLEANNIAYLDKSIFQNLTNLAQLHLQHNRLIGINKELLSKLFGLKLLNLAGNSIREIEIDSFSHLRRLRNLWLKRNQISQLADKIFTNLTKLEFINLEMNFISHIGAHAFPDTATLQEVYIAGNNLQHLDGTITDQLRRLSYLTLYNNPWFCDCRLQQLHNIWQNHTQSPKPECAGPEKFQNLPWNKLSAVDFCMKSASKVSASATVLKDELIFVLLGENVSFKCKIQAQEVQWLYRNSIFNGDSVSASGQQYTILIESQDDILTSVLTIARVKIDDGGRYTCQQLSANTENESTNSSFSLMIIQGVIDTEYVWKIVFYELTVLLILIFIIFIAVVVYKYMNKTERNYVLFNNLKQPEIQLHNVNYEGINASSSTDTEEYLDTLRSKRKC